MKVIRTYASVTLATLLLTSSCFATEHTITSNTETHEKDWGYTSDVSPSHWSELNKKFKICSEGKSQSPIDIVPSSHLNLPPLELDYESKSQNVIDNGHTVQVNVAEGSTFTIGDETYELKQFHFHTPSENNINHKSFPLEAHFVHATKDGKLAVIAVMFEEAKDINAVISKIWSKFPLKTGEKTELILTTEEIQALMPNHKEYYKFIGSLTTPPCSEEVRWHVLKKPLSISKEQVKQFFNIYGHSNNRPIQAVNKRNILE
ncbi:MAG: Carbonic anhydrase (EC [uncultured Sulfurovum sp.]|uniref:Carbonic anhydrase n=1 Tax=uncultured Sulfurovum sp. TaxID=269237 RepID=A0A6S6SDY2_9BACT|nr:MAG: Carbonic anhydrase (EC [uncultured Sulfurovum sp.]